MEFNSGFKGLNEISFSKINFLKVSFILVNSELYLYFRTVHVVIFILFKPTHALFLKHIHINIQNTKLLKIFVKRTIKTLHVSVTIGWPPSGGRLSCLVLLLLLCLFASSSCLFGMWLYVVCSIIFALQWFHDFIYQDMKKVKHMTEKGCGLTYVCACLMYLSVGCLVVNCLSLRVGAARVHITGLVRWPAVPVLLAVYLNVHVFPVVHFLTFPAWLY